MIKYITAGESHGKCLTALVEGMPSGVKVTAEDINGDLARRQGGYGRGGRMKIEKDKVEFTAGIRRGLTLGSPVAMVVKNRDWENWTKIMGSEPGPPLDKDKADDKVVTKPRPGHADLSGAMKYDFDDLRNVLERSSARETAARVAVGALSKSLLAHFGIGIYSWVIEIGGVTWDVPLGSRVTASGLHNLAEKSEVRCPDAKATRKMKTRIDKARKDGDSVGGLYEVAVTGLGPGVGSYVHYERKLDGRLAQAIMSIQAMKGVEIGMGFGVGSTVGSMVHDEINYKKGSGKKGGKTSEFWPQSPMFTRSTNNAGGIEGGMSNGETILVRGAMKPIPTLYKPLKSVDMDTKRSFKASIERSDFCAVPAASVVAEAAVAFEIAKAFLEKFGGDSVKEITRNYKGYLKQVRSI